MKIESFRDSLFEVWEGPYFIGNGGAVKGYEGEDFLVTAHHVAFYSGIPKSVTLKRRNGTHLLDFPITFQSVPGRDLAVAKAPHHLRGLRMANEMIIGDQIQIIGSICGSPFELATILNYAGQPSMQIESPGKRRTVYTTLVTSMQYANPAIEKITFHGVSGSLVFDEHNDVIGVHSSTFKPLPERRITEGMYNVGEVLGSVRTRS